MTNLFMLNETFTIGFNYKFLNLDINFIAISYMFLCILLVSMVIVMLYSTVYKYIKGFGGKEVRRNSMAKGNHINL